jgi:SAM-dependent methyltransferase
MTRRTEKDQESHWDAETRKYGYCEGHLRNLESLNVPSMFERCLGRVPPMRVGARALEVGGGSQFLSRWLCGRYPHLHVVCSDISEQRVAIFDAYYGGTRPDNLTLRGGVNLEELPFEDAEFDLIFGDAVLHHVERTKIALSEVNRCLPIGGRAIFVREPVIGALGGLVYRALQAIDLEADHMERNRFEYKKTLAQWTYELVMTGFEVELVRYWPHQNMMMRVKNSFPSLLPCYPCFLLHKKRHFTWG